MTNYLIEEAKCGITNGGMACGPYPGTVVTAVKYRKGQKSKWLYLSEVDGIPCFTLTDKDIYNDLLKEDVDNEEFIEYLNAHSIDKLDGIEFSGDYGVNSYGDIFDSISENPENPVIPLIRYIIALTRCEKEETEPLIRMAQGKYVNELEIPVSDIEEEYREEAMAEDEE